MIPGSGWAEHSPGALAPGKLGAVAKPPHPRHFPVSPAVAPLEQVLKSPSRLKSALRRASRLLIARVA